MMINKSKLIILIAIILCVPLLAYAKKGGNPDNLQQQIDELRLRVEALEQAPGGGIQVYDANGQYLGILVSTVTNLHSIYIPSVKATLTISYDGTLYPSVHNLYFENSNCTGQPYVELQKQIQIVYNSSMTYRPTGPYMDMNYGSYRHYNGTCYPQVSTLQGIIAEEVVLPFTIPIDMPLSLE